jgi:hypothetical protein
VELMPILLFSKKRKLATMYSNVRGSGPARVCLKHLGLDSTGIFRGTAPTICQRYTAATRTKSKQSNAFKWQSSKLIGRYILGTEQLF